jgi:DNA-binding NtrC family response regulator
MVRARAQVDAAVASRASTLIHGPDATALAEVAETIHYRLHATGQAALWRIEADQALPSELSRALSALARHEGDASLVIESIDHLPAELQAELLTGLADDRWHAQLLATQSTRDSDSELGMSDELAAAVSTLMIEIPPLADRPEDLPPLVAWHLERLNQDSAEPVYELTDDAMDLLIVYPWPGETTELAEVLTSAHLRAKGPQIAARDLPKPLHHAMEHAALASDPPEPIDLDDYLSRVEGALVERALELAGGNKAEAARLLGVSRPRLYRKLVQMGLAEPPPSDQKPREKQKPEKLPQPPLESEIEFLPVDEEDDVEDAS